jgi:CubicO group peptidase (beta-lactamase class C family)
MKRIITARITTLIITLIGALAALPALAQDDAIVAAATAAVDKAVADDQFSGVVLIAKEGKPLLSRAWGMADPAQNVANDPETKFNLGSINKIFTQVAVAQLAAAGKLALTDTVRKHLPDYPSPAADRITIEQLVAHRSGLGDFFGPKFQKSPHSLRKLSDYLPLFAAEPLLFEPGSDQRYSNAGYVVLGLIVERLSGQSYYDYVRDHITVPAGMKDTASYPFDAEVANRAIGQTKRGPDGPLALRQANTATLPGRGSSAGGGYSTAADMLRFAEALSTDKLTPPKWTDWIFHTGPEKNGRSLGIAGGAPGINAVVQINPPYTAVILSNYDPPSAETIARAVRPLLGGGNNGQHRMTRNAEPDEVMIRGPLEVPMTMTGHVPVLEATINGKGPFRIEFDSGFGGLFEVSEALAAQLGLEQVGEAIGGDPSGRNTRTMKLYRADSVDFGSVHFGGVEAMVSGATRLAGVDGVVGLNLFRSFLVTFDYPGKSIRVAPGKLPIEGTLAYSAEHGVPSIEIDVNGQKINVDVDSGSPAELTLPLSMAKSLPLSEEPRVVGHGRTVANEFDVYGAALKGEVRAGGIVLTDPRLDFVEIFPHGNLGSRFLRNLVVTFDPANRRLKFAR